MPKNYFIIINNYYFNTSFFINSFDSILNLYPQYYLNYFKQLFNINRINLMFKNFFKFNSNLNYFINLIKYFNLYIFNKLNNNLLNYLKKKVYINLNIYKLLKYNNMFNGLNTLLYFNNLFNFSNLKILMFNNNIIPFKINKFNNQYFNLIITKQNYYNIKILHFSKFYILNLLNSFLKNSKILFKYKSLNIKIFNDIYLNSIKLNNLKKF
jgi:hypothetical protein